MNLPTRLGRALLLFAALVLGGCPPPGDVGSKPKQAATQTAPTTPGDTKDPAGATPTDATPAPTQSEPVAPVAGPAPKPVAYEHLAGGVFVPRCPACGTVQREAADKCPACGQMIRPWRQEQACTACAGFGVCDRCGDDRMCLDCDGQGVCPFCDGSGKLGDDKCPECSGNAKCTACGGDGRRESANHDFGPRETALPGVCPTCVGGSGLCPDCGTLTKDRANGTCLTCGGLGICLDCGGTGKCPHDGGDGLCVVCRGTGREVFDGDPPKLSDRAWVLRLKSGTPFTGRVLAHQDNNLHVQATQGPKAAPVAYTRSQLDPMTFYLAVRDRTPETDGKARLELGTIALSSGFWALARRDFKQAMDAEPSLASEVTAQIREIDARRTMEWLDSADKAKKAGDRDGAALYLELVRFSARGTPQATRADVVALQMQRDREEEARNLDDAAKARTAEEAKARVERASQAARLRLDRARKLVETARKLPATDPSVDRLYARADEAAYMAQRIVQRTAYRDPASITPWPAKPEVTAKEARLLRSQIAEFHAVREIAGGRYDFGRRLAERAVSLDATNAQAPRLVEAADLGAARRGVLRGSPPPTPK